MRDALVIGGMEVKPGALQDIKLKVSEQVTSTPVFIPVTVLHGAEPGPRIFVTAAIHGDEINGVEMIRRIRAEIRPGRVRGTLLLVPIANPISFMMQSRDLPDGRDLNRCFPGSSRGSMASMMAAAIFRKVVRASDFGIDIHTAARGRENYPHVRADLSVPVVRRLAFAFGTEVIVDMPGTKGMLRYAATRKGVPTIVYEAGSPMRFQNRLVVRGLEGIRNVLADLGVYPFRRKSPRAQVVVKERQWIRARQGGILMLKVRPGDIIEEGEIVAVNTKPLGAEVREIRAPFAGLVVGTTTVPMVHPGSAVCHLVHLGRRHRTVARLLRPPRNLFE